MSKTPKRPRDLRAAAHCGARLARLDAWIAAPPKPKPRAPRGDPSLGREGACEEMSRAAPAALS